MTKKKPKAKAKEPVKKAIKSKPKKKSVKKQEVAKPKECCPDGVCPIKKKNCWKPEQLSVETLQQPVSWCQRIFRFFCG